MVDKGEERGIVVSMSNCRPIGTTAPAGRQGFPRGEAVTKIGSSEPILVTDEECGRKSHVFSFVRTSSGSLDIAVPHLSALRAATFPSGEGIRLRRKN